VAVGGLIVEGATIESSPHHALAIHVRNEGTQMIVAWGVQATLTDATSVVKHVGGGIDGFEYDLRVLANDPVLRPNGSYTARFDLPQNFEPVSVTANPTYAIFDDNSAEGDERSIQMQFEHRARDAAGWHFTERAVEEALANNTTAEDVLRFVDAKMVTASQDVRGGSTAGWQVPQRIRIALRSPDTAQSLVDELRLEAGLRAKAAAARSIRRK
jgi:hypothetical protein